MNFNLEINELAVKLPTFLLAHSFYEQGKK